MKRAVTVPILILAAAWVYFAVGVVRTSDQLPARVATHFGAGGVPDGWMTRDAYVRFTLVASGFVAVLVSGLGAAIRRFRGVGLNLPYKEYWLAPERQQATVDYIQRWAIGCAVLLLGFFAGMHRAVLSANDHAPALLREPEFAWLFGVPLVAVLLWSSMLVVHFFRKTP